AGRCAAPAAVLAVADLLRDPQRHLAATPGRAGPPLPQEFEQPVALALQAVVAAALGEPDDFAQRRLELASGLRRLSVERAAVDAPEPRDLADRQAVPEA